MSDGDPWRNLVDRAIDSSAEDLGELLHRHGLDISVQVLSAKASSSRSSNPLILTAAAARGVAGVAAAIAPRAARRASNFASVTLDPHPPAWLKRDCGVSWGYKVFGRREAYWGSNVEHITKAFIEEISVLRSMTPAQPGARVVWVGESQESPAAVLTSNRAVAGDEDDDYRPPVWDELERIVGYRVTDENQEQACLDANRRPLDRIYDEWQAAKRTEPQVLVRRNIGKVLGVR